MKVLIIDEHILFRQQITNLIAHQPDLSVAGEGGSVHEAVDLAHKLRPDLILMDINLPDGTGLDAAQTILGALPNTKVVLMTMEDDEELLFAAVRVGVRGFLKKNIPVPRLLAALRGVGHGEAALSREMTAHLMKEYARSNRPSGDHKESPFTGLTARELQVLRELTAEITNREIADRLYISENTVRNHMHSILEKMGVSNRRQAVNLARQHGIGANASAKE